MFVTGGIGGVHRGVEETMDVSADLTELGRTPVCVVCAGVKSILDIPKTLEYLETQGVTVASYGTDEFPAFFTSTSGSKAQVQLNNAKDCAKVICKQICTNILIRARYKSIAKFAIWYDCRCTHSQGGRSTK